MIAVVGAVDRAAKVRANRRQAAEGVALAHEENPFVLQKGHRAVGIILGLAGLETLARLEEHVGHQKAHRARRGRGHGKGAGQPAERELEETAPGNVVFVWGVE